MIEDFTVNEFTEFSDHAPICLTLKICVKAGDNCKCVKSNETYISWNSEAADQLYQCILIKWDTLAACADNIVDTNQSVQNFMKTPNDITDEFCQKSYIKTDTCDTCKANSHFRQSDNHDKPWFNEKCVPKRYSTYKKALCLFNKDKSLYNRLNLANKKADYKSCVANAKRRYLRQESGMLGKFKANKPAVIPQTVSENEKEDHKK